MKEILNSIFGSAEPVVVVCLFMVFVVILHNHIVGDKNDKE